MYLEPRISTYVSVSMYLPYNWMTVPILIFQTGRLIQLDNRNRSFGIARVLSESGQQNLKLQIREHTPARVRTDLSCVQDS